MNELPFYILIVDDQKADRLSNRAECTRVFGNYGNSLVIEDATSIDEAIQKMTSRIYQIVLLDKDLGTDAGGDQISGIDHLHLLREIQPVSQIIMLTASEKPHEISRALRNGAYDYMVKGADEERASQREATLKRAYHSAMDGIALTMNQQKSSSSGLYQDFICQSPVMVRFDQKIRAVADSQHPALLLGPSGIGKGAIARRINGYRSKNQPSQRPFVNINIGSMPDSLAQAELFGQDPFSFTGSGPKMKTGLIDMAKNGDIFLDEVGDASPEMQLRLLKVVEEKEYIRVGGKVPIKTNARFIFATNKDIKVLVTEGKFREDLYMRIAALELEVPSLEERKEELPVIVESICSRIRATTPGKKIFFKDFPEDFAKYVIRDNVPGNIRGIQNIIERFVTFANFDKKGFPEYKNWKSIIGVTENTRRKGRDGRLKLSEIASAETEFIGDGFQGYKSAQKVFDRKLIEEAIAKYHNLSIASKHLKISKATLSIKMKALNIKVPRREADATPGC